MTRQPSFSFEFFPPRDEAALARGWKALTYLARFKPKFVSVTYGAGGKTRENTHTIVNRILAETELAVAAHLTCVGQSQNELLGIAKRYWNEGVRHLVLLRGDMPDMGEYKQHKNGFNSTPDFINAIKGCGEFEISVSFYPEKHPHSQFEKADLALLKQKQEAGAVRAISQFCFDDEVFLRKRDEAVTSGITIPIVPGIMPTTNFNGVVAMAQKSATSIPNWLSAAYDGIEDLTERRKLAIDIALKQCDNLFSNGVEHFHFYTLNQIKVTEAVCTALLTS